MNAPILRDYQQKSVNDCYVAWNEGDKVLMPVLPTGGGKTVVVGHVAEEVHVPTCFIAHRRELVQQLSIAMARNKMRHRVIAPPGVISEISRMHIRMTGFDFVDRNSKNTCAGVDMINKMGDSEELFKYTKMYVQDEGHHVLKENKWGKAARKFHKDCFALLPTATPERGDGKGLGVHSSGIVDRLIPGPGMRLLINRGMLCDYRITIVESDLDLSKVPITPSGDFEPKAAAAAVKRSSVIGDVVSEYLRLAPGERGLIFAADVEQATDLAQRFRQRGVKAEVVTGETPGDVRTAILGKLESLMVEVIVNVDLFGEGTDLPAVSYVAFARPTDSPTLYPQQFGRGLRLLIEKAIYAHWNSYTDSQRLVYIANSTKPYARIVDHVGNIMHRHGLPDRERVWSLDGSRARDKHNDQIPLRLCPNCTNPYERVLAICPYCTREHVPAERKTPADVDGRMLDLEPEILEAMRRAATKWQQAPVLPLADRIVQLGVSNRHREMQDEMRALHAAMSLWGGHQESLGRSVGEAQSRFYYAFGIDALTAMTLPRADAAALRAKIQNKLDMDRIINKGA